MNPAQSVPLMVPLFYLIMLATESSTKGRVFPQVRNWKRIGFSFFILLMSLSIILPVFIPAVPFTQNSPAGVIDNRLISILFTLLFTTFVSYWFHRAEHHFKWLWRIFHQIHHSAERVDIAGAFYTHPLEMIIKMTISWAIAGHLVGLDTLSTAVVVSLVGLLSMFGHWNIRTPHWLGYLIPRPESHCYHHEYDIHSRNYGDLPLWDMLFNTYLNPKDSAQLLVGFGGNSIMQLPEMLFCKPVEKKHFLPD